MNEPCSSGSDRPGILPARRPCFTTAKLSPGKDNKETPEAKIVLLFTNKEEHLSLSMLISFEAEAATVLRVPFWSVCEEGEIIRMCWGFLQQSTLVVDKADAMSSKVYVLIDCFIMREKKNRIGHLRIECRKSWKLMSGGKINVEVEVPIRLPSSKNLVDTVLLCFMKIEHLFLLG